jgi:DNA replication and repair protein RecF
VIVTHLSLTDFRNYETAEVPLVAGANLFVGSNGQGKTNLVESLGYLSTLGSHRVSVDHAMIRQGTDSAIVRARLENGERQLLVEVQLNRSTANRAQVNRSVIKTRELPRYFSSVLFAPEDLALIRGDPSGRRRFLDELLTLRSPRLSAVMADYDRVLRQRNTLLKSARASGLKDTRLGTLEIWDDRLVSLGTELMVARSVLVAELEPEVSASYVAVAGADHQASLALQLSLFSGPGDLGRDDSDGGDPDLAGSVRADPISSADTADAFRTALARLRRSELDRGITLVGPHRDDLVLQLNGLPAKGYASHGESWSFALALKLASAELLRRESATGDPVLMLDDVFAELDEARRARLATAVAGYEQVLITAAVFDDVPVELRGNAVHIANGTVIPKST